MSDPPALFRIHTAVPRFSEEQLRYLTDVDQVDHVAWAALDPAAPDVPGAGVGRRTPALPASTPPGAGGPRLGSGEGATTGWTNAAAGVVFNPPPRVPWRSRSESSRAQIERSSEGI